MNYKDILGEPRGNAFGIIKFPKLDEYHEYIVNGKWIEEKDVFVESDTIYLDGNFNAYQLEALSLFIKERLNEQNSSNS